MLSLQILQHKQRVTKEEAYSFIGLLPEADLGEGSRGSGPPPPPFYSKHMYETTGFMLYVIVTQYRIVLYI